MRHPVLLRPIRGHSIPMIEWLTQHATEIFEKGNYWAGFLAMMLESMIAPLPSEVVMPPIGMLVAAGKLSLFWALVATSLGSIAGSLISYYMGYFGGKPAVLKFGKYLFLNEQHLAWTEKWFHSHGGVTVFVGRFVPVVRHLISIPAGTGKMPMLPFLFYTLVGATMWNGFLLWLGMKLQQNWTVILKYRRPLDIGVVLLLLAACVYFFLHHVLPGWRAARARAAAAGAGDVSPRP